MKQFFSEKGIQKFAAQNSKIKAAVAERGLRTLKNRLYKYFSEKNTTKWIDVLPKFLHAINNSICRITGITPASINEHNWPETWEKVYGNTISEDKFKQTKLKKGDHVRTSIPKQIFDKGYFPSRSDHIYTIEQGNSIQPETYEIKDYHGNVLKEKFYRPELVKTQVDETTSYRIEKVIKKRRNKNGEKEFLVKFIGYPEKYWIKENELIT